MFPESWGALLGPVPGAPVPCWSRGWLRVGVPWAAFLVACVRSPLLWGPVQPCPSVSKGPRSAACPGARPARGPVGGQACPCRRRHVARRGGPYALCALPWGPSLAANDHVSGRLGVLRGSLSPARRVSLGVSGGQVSPCPRTCVAVGDGLWPGSVLRPGRMFSAAATRGQAWAALWRAPPWGPCMPCRVVTCLAGRACFCVFPVFPRVFPVAGLPASLGCPQGSGLPERTSVAPGDDSWPGPALRPGLLRGTRLVVLPRGTAFRGALGWAVSHPSCSLWVLIHVALRHGFPRRGSGRLAPVRPRLCAAPPLPLFV
ncbi:uncharacterized protein [Procambarus clarkii]|uniref:uncharacterized protein n=1 Tax=Procambarus clarkii TaxID=6728 RepID=UPI0037433005